MFRDERVSLPKLEPSQAVLLHHVRNQPDKLLVVEMEHIEDSRDRRWPLMVPVNIQGSPSRPANSGPRGSTPCGGQLVTLDATGIECFPCQPLPLDLAALVRS
jgi:hypothetical protein